MKKYKLIKKYPFGPKTLGLEIDFDNVNHYWKSLAFNYHKNLFNPKDYPEYWEKVIEKDYEILEFYKDGFAYKICKDGNLLFKCEEYKNININSHGCHWTKASEKGYKIHSVKRLLDGKIFTIGDKVTSLSEKGKIEEFRIFGNNEIGYFLEIVFEYKLYYKCVTTINQIQHVKQPLFTTEDGVDVFEGDEYYFTNIVKFNLDEPYSNILNKKANTGDVEAEKNYPNTWKNFSTKQAAEEWIIMNKPCLSYNDIISNITWLDNSKKLLKEIVKSKLNL